MSVSTECYLVFGWYLPYDFMDDEDRWNKDYLPYIEGHENVNYSLIIDGMNGDYIVFGKAIHLPSLYEDKDYMEIDIYIDDFEKEKLMKKFEELFNKKPKTIPKLFHLIHYC